MAKIKLELGTDGYRLNVDGEMSEVTDYGEPLEVVFGGKTYIACLDLPEGKDEAEDVESAFSEFLYVVTPVADVETVEVDFGEEEEEEDEEEEDEEDEEEVVKG